MQSRKRYETWRMEFRYLGSTDVALFFIDRTAPASLTVFSGLYRTNLSAGPASIDLSHRREIRLGL